MNTYWKSDSRKDFSAVIVLTVAFCFLVGGGSPAGAGPAESPFDFKTVRLIPVFHNDRPKPLDTMARETMRQISGREYWPSSKAPHPWLHRDPMTNLLSMLFQPDEWKSIPCIHVDKADLKELLGMDKRRDEWTSYQDLRANEAFQEKFREIRRKQSAEDSPKLSPLESEVADLHGVLNAMDGVFTGMAFRIIPGGTEEGRWWLSLQELAHEGEDEEIRGLLRDLMTAFLEERPADFRSAGMKLASVLRERGHELYPAMGLLEKEVLYNTLKPFRKALELLLVASILFAFAMGLKARSLYYGAWAFYAGGFLMSSYALFLRVVIAGRPPVSNMYESVVYMGWGVILFAGIFELVYRQRIFGLCGSAMGVLVLALADMLPFDPAISPLVPVLRSNYWLVIHVMTIVISYSAFGLAMMIAHFSLAYYLFAPHQHSIIRTANKFVYRSIQVGVLLLAAGTILGGVWANESWGRFWGWDPKETWAFISLMGYLALLHARYTRMVGAFGTAIGAIIGFQLILMTWYGVNFILAAGLHSYGFGAGGTGYIIAYLVAETAFMILVAVRYRMVRHTLNPMPTEEKETGSQTVETGREPQPSTS